MGAEIHIRLESDKYDNKELAPFLGRDFYYEITRKAIWEDKESFLSKTEFDLLEAPYYEEFEDDSVKVINPADLIVVLEKVKKHLKENKDSLPFEVKIDFERMEKQGLTSDLIVNGSRCWIRGDSLYHDVSDKVEIVNYPMEPNKVDLLVDILEELEIDGRKYFLKKISRFEKFAETIDKVTEFCQLAENNNEKIYWLYSH